MGKFATKIDNKLGLDPQRGTWVFFGWVCAVGRHIPV